MKGFKGMKRMITVGLVGVTVAMSMTACGSKVPETGLINYEVYNTFNQNYKDMGNSLVAQYVKDGMSEEEACGQAITEVIEQQWRDEQEFANKYLMDEDSNGVYDAVERGEITQTEIDKHWEGWIECGAGAGASASENYETGNEV